MKDVWICIAVVAAVAVVSIWACCKAAGDCDREEEEKNDG